MAGSCDSLRDPRCVLCKSSVMVPVHTTEELVLPVVVEPLMLRRQLRCWRRIMGFLAPCTLPPESRSTAYGCMSTHVLMAW